MSILKSFHLKLHLNIELFSSKQENISKKIVFKQNKYIKIHI